MLLEKVVISGKRGSLPFSLSSVMLLAIKMNSFVRLVCREICLLFYCANKQKSLGNTTLSRSCNYIALLST